MTQFLQRRCRSAIFLLACACLISSAQNAPSRAPVILSVVDLGLRGVMENATDRRNPLVVNNVVDSPQFGACSESFGRALTARLRLI